MQSLSRTSLIQSSFWQIVNCLQRSNRDELWRFSTFLDSWCTLRFTLWLTWVEVAVDIGMCWLLCRLLCLCYAICCLVHFFPHWLSFWANSLLYSHLEQENVLSKQNSWKSQREWHFCAFALTAAPALFKCSCYWCLLQMFSRKFDVGWIPVWPKGTFVNSVFFCVRCKQCTEAKCEAQDDCVHP